MSVLGRLCERALRETDGARGDERARNVEGAHRDLCGRGRGVSERGRGGRAREKRGDQRRTLKPSPSLPRRFSFGTTTFSATEEASARSTASSRPRQRERDAPKLMMRVSEQRWPMLISLFSTLQDVEPVSTSARLEATWVRERGTHVMPGVSASTMKPDSDLCGLPDASVLARTKYHCIGESVKSFS